MRLKGEIPVENEEEGEEEKGRDVNSLLRGVGFHQPQKLVVGYALTSKKKKSFLQPKLLGLARSKGVFFVAIDLNRPLSDQGPFDILLHKVRADYSFRLSHYHFECLFLSGRPFNSCPCCYDWNWDELSGNEWCDLIEDYKQKHPEVIVLDPPKAIRHLHNRQSMLQDVADLDLSEYDGKVGIPRQLVITKDPLSIPYEVTKAGLSLPLVAKPLLVDGTAKSHELFLAYDQFSLPELEPPLVLQEFVNHGGVLFKIYVVGESIKVVRRFSLPDVTKCELAEVAGLFRFPRVSCAAATADDADLDPSIAELPPRPLLERLAKELRRRLGLELFNIDMIRQLGTKDVFFVIDINYFPGYGKMPDYEHIFTDFLLSLVQNKYKKRHAT